MIFSEKTIEIKENMTFSFLIDGYIFLKDSGFMALFRGGRSLLQWDVCNNSNSEAVTGNQEYIKIGNETTSKMATIVHQNQ